MCKYTRTSTQTHTHTNIQHTHTNTHPTHTHTGRRTLSFPEGLVYTHMQLVLTVKDKQQFVKESLSNFILEMPTVLVDIVVVTLITFLTLITLIILITLTTLIEITRTTGKP